MQILGSETAEYIAYIAIYQDRELNTELKLGAYEMPVPTAMADNKMWVYRVSTSMKNEYII